MTTPYWDGYWKSIPYIPRNDSNALPYFPTRYAKFSDEHGNYSYVKLTDAFLMKHTSLIALSREISAEIIQHSTLLFPSWLERLWLRQYSNIVVIRASTNRIYAVVQCSQAMSMVATVLEDNKELIGSGRVILYCRMKKI